MRLYPLAFAVVEVESKESWGFFFNCLEDILGGFEDEKPWTFMSDRQKVTLLCYFLTYIYIFVSVFYLMTLLLYVGTNGNHH
ncbi:hypothetical protein KSP39_PZI008079 [Platanthera zijinensis]|uniref:MULE transposase domain-containing protein n=1 Tax=Platanthera zijinensis TaxID=2320716 RepID=A0AAP0BN18_9ASPA